MTQDGAGAKPRRASAEERRAGAAAIGRAAGGARGPLRLLTAASVAHALAILFLPESLGHAVDVQLGGAPRDAGPLFLTWLAATVALVAVIVAASAAVAFAGGAATAATSAGLRRALLGHSTAAGPALAASIGPGDLVSRGTGNAGQAGAVPTNTVAVWAGALPAFGALVMLFRIDWRCGGAFLVGLALLGATMTLLIGRTTSSAEQYQAAQGEIAGGLTEALAGARTIGAAGTLEPETRRILGPLPRMREHGFSIWRAQAAGIGQAALLIPMLEIAVVAVAGWQLTRGHLTIGQMLAASGYVVLAAEMLASLGAAVALAQGRSAAGRCAAVLAVPATPYGTSELPPGYGTIDMDDLWVGSAEDAALRDVNLTIIGRTTVAIVGASGSGKSTLAAVIGRLVTPDAGLVRLDGVPLQELTSQALHGAVSYAFARPALLGRTVADTIAMGARVASAEEVAAAADDACAAPFIARLPLGYATPLADAPLSGGEAQRLGLARAFAHAGRVLVLDDATSSLDTVTEVQVSDALATRHPGRTRVIVAHRASTAARADAVIWLDHGAVRGYATHRRLWADPAYRAVFAGEDGACTPARAPQPGQGAVVVPISTAGRGGHRP